MRKPRWDGADSNAEVSDIKQRFYNIITLHPQVSRPSTLRTLEQASAAKALWLFDIKPWVNGPPGQPMPLLVDYGLNLAQPSSDEMLARFGGGA